MFAYNRIVVAFDEGILDVGFKRFVVAFVKKPNLTVGCKIPKKKLWNIVMSIRH